MESPYVAAWDNQQRRLIPLAHRRCAVPPGYAVHRPLATEFDYRGRTCGICSLPLVTPSPPRAGQPLPPEEVRTGDRLPSRGAADGVLVLVYDAKRDDFLKAHAACAAAKRYRVVRDIARGLSWRDPRCDICSRQLEH